MTPEEFQDLYLEYLCGAKTPEEKAAWERALSQEPELQAQFRSAQRLQKLYRDHLPDPVLPRHLVTNTFKSLGIKRPWYETLFGHSMWKMSLVAVSALVLTLGLTYGYRQWNTPDQLIAQSSPPAEKTVTLDLNRQDFQLAARSLEPRLYPQTWRQQPRLGNGLVSLASYGGSSMPYEAAASDDIPRLDQQTELSLAQFSHQQALRMRAMGDFKGAANQLAQLIKQFPSYPHVFVAAAQRIDCLFKAGETKVARQELALLREHSPDLAFLVEQRWGDSLR